MECPHCMQDSKPEPMHMSQETLDQVIQHAKEAGVHAILISGGEPTEHPQFKEITERIISEFPMIGIISNGQWIDDPEKTKILQELMKNPGVFLQITNVPGIYPKGINEEKIKELFPGTPIEHGPLHIMTLGRARGDERFEKEAREDSLTTTSCFSSALTVAQLPYKETLRNLEIRGKFCHPLVDWKGKLHWSESWLCPSFAEISESLEEISKKAKAWRPCGACPDYKKLLGKKDRKYIVAKEILKIHD